MSPPPNQLGAGSGEQGGLRAETLLRMCGTADTILMLVHDIHELIPAFFAIEDRVDLGILLNTPFLASDCQSISIVLRLSLCHYLQNK